MTTEDAKHVQRTLKGILLEERILGVETGACPHTAVREDPSMNLAAVEDMEARFPDGDVVLIESGGDNLTLTFSPALVDFFIYVIDVAAGDKIPRKNGPGITQSDILVINKTDLAPLRRREPRGDGARFAADARRQAVPVHQLQDRRGHPGAGRPDSQRPAVRPETPSNASPVMGAMRVDGGTAAVAAGVCGLRRRAAADAQRRRGKPGLLRLGFESGGDRTMLADLRAARLVSRSARSTATSPAGHGVAFHDHHDGLRAPGRPAALDVALGPARGRMLRRNRRPRSTRWTRTTARRRRSSRSTKAYLEFLPDPLFPHRDARFASDTRIRFPSATLLYSEIVQPGRKHHEASESLAVTLLALEVNAERPDGELLMRERLVLDPKEIAPRQTGVMDSFDVFANVLLLTPKTKAQRVAARLRRGSTMSSAWRMAPAACRTTRALSTRFWAARRRP